MTDETEHETTSTFSDGGWGFCAIAANGDSREVLAIDGAHVHYLTQ
jgi:hypothetical protein